jgi:hypothetical protein
MRNDKYGRLLITSRHGPTRKYSFSVAVHLLLWNCCVLVCWWSNFEATVVVTSLISLSFPSNGSRCHNIFEAFLTWLIFVDVQGKKIYYVMQREINFSVINLQQIINKASKIRTI